MQIQYMQIQTYADSAESDANTYTDGREVVINAAYIAADVVLDTKIDANVTNMTHFHSSVQTVTASQETTNASATVAFTFTELANARHYVVLVNRLVLRPTEYSVSGNVVTIASGSIIAEDDEMEVTGFSLAV